MRYHGGGEHRGTQQAEIAITDVLQGRVRDFAGLFATVGARGGMECHACATAIELGRRTATEAVVDHFETERDLTSVED